MPPSPGVGGGRRRQGRGLVGGGSNRLRHFIWGLIWMLVMCVTPLAWFGYNFVHRKKGYINLDVWGGQQYPSTTTNEEIRGEIIALETTNEILKNELERARLIIKELQQFKTDIMKANGGGCGNGSGNNNGTLILSVQDLESSSNNVANNIDVIMEEKSDHWMLHQQLKRREQRQQQQQQQNNNANSTTSTIPTGTTTGTMSAISTTTKKETMESAKAKLKQARLNGSKNFGGRRNNYRPPLPKQNEKRETKY